MTELERPLDTSLPPPEETHPVSSEDLANAGNVLAALALEAEKNGVEPTIEDVNEAFVQGEVPLTVDTPEVRIMRELLYSKAFPARLSPDKRALIASSVIEADKRISKVRADSTPIDKKPFGHYELLLRHALAKGRTRSLREV